MRNPYFSIVIPTRDRATYLPFAVKSCLAQDFDDYEIVVCDNFSSDHTQLVLDQFTSDKIKRIRTEQPLAMCDNWEIALSHAQGQYITVLGDDDALMPFALSCAYGWLEATKSLALCWGHSYYEWPDYPIAQQANRLFVPLGIQAYNCDFAEAISRVLRVGGYDRLPGIYNGFVSRVLIDKLRQITGRVFGAINPDIYTAFAFAYLAKHYYSLDRPLSLAGHSGKSNGTAHMVLTGQSPIAKDFGLLCHKSTISRCETVPNIPFSMWGAVWDSHTKARESLGLTEVDRQLDQPVMLRQIAMDLYCHPNLSEMEFNHWKAYLIDWCGDKVEMRQGLVSFFDKLAPRVERKDNESRKLSTTTGLWIDCDEFQIKDILGAVDLYQKLFGRHVYESSQWVATKLEEKPEVRKYYSPDELVDLLSRRELLHAIVKRTVRGAQRWFAS